MNDKISISVESGKAKRLLTKGKICKDDIVVIATGGKTKIHNCDFLFQGNRRTEQIDEFDLSEIESAKSMFEGATALTETPESLNLSKSVTCERVYYGCAAATYRNLDMSNAEMLDNAFAKTKSGGKIVGKIKTTNKCKTMGALFSDAQITTEIPFGEHDIDSSEVANFSAMFSWAHTVDIGEWRFDTSNGSNFDSMLSGNANLPMKLTYAKMNFSKAEHLSKTFFSARQMTAAEFTFSENTTGFTADTFYGCVALTDLTVIGTLAESVNFSRAPLTADSAISVITALKDFSGTDSEFTQTVTFSATTKAALEALGATAPNGLTWLQYITAKGWLYA